MPIQYALPVGTILLCDYDLGGFREPEMVKRRPAIIISPRLPYRDGLCTVVPLSGSPPKHEVPYQCRIEMDQPLPDPFPYKAFWAKADMLATVGFGRLDMFRTGRDQEGKRKYLQPKLNTENIQRVRQAVLSALGMVSS